MPDLITRQFRVMRGDREIVYGFTTFATIFQREGQPFDFLKDVFTNGIPNFESSFESISEMKKLIIPEFTHTKKHGLIDFAKAADYRGRGNRQHDCIQKHLMKFDPHTVAIEIPVWSAGISGHLDLLRIYPRKDSLRFGIWDFKPDAHKERKADSQVWRYRDAFCHRTRIDPNHVEIGYFDDKNAYLFNPQT